MTKIPTSLFSRGSKLLGIASKVALGEISSKLKTWETEKEKLLSKIEMAQDVVKTLSELKGASMKLGQLLSLDLGDYLPPEILKILEKLHHQSTFLEFDKIQMILEAELGEKLSLLKSIEPVPLAAASIGQVHGAYLGEKRVVIKVQYPGVAESIPSDLKILETIIKQITFLQRKNIDLHYFFDEVREVLLKEADYENELKMHEIYLERFKNSPYIIPTPYPDLSTKKILTQDYIEGVSFTQWLETKPSLSERSRLADLLMKLYLEEVFVHGLVQTDPNPGNFLITKEGNLALLDFGAVKEFSNTFRVGYRNILLAAFDKKAEVIIEESLRLNFLDPREDQIVRDTYLEMMEFLVQPFRGDNDFDFTDKSFFIRSRNLSLELAKKSKFSPPPRDLLFLHRKLGGIFVFIKKLDVKMRLRDYWHYVEKP